MLETYFFWAAMFVFAAYVLLRAFAARIYADALAEGVRERAVELHELGAFERGALDRLDLVRPDPETERHPLLVAVRGVAAWSARTAAIGVAALVWFAFVSQIFVSEFLNYHPVVGWLNQPLVQLPWFHYVPAALGAG